MSATRLRAIALPLTLAASASIAASPVRAQIAGFDSTAVAAVYHHLTGDSLDLRSAAERSPAVQRATNFDRPDAITAEMARLQTIVDKVDPTREFVISVNDNISEYDHEHGEFSIGLFQPGYFVPLQAFGQSYQLVFANAEHVRPIPMDKAAARDFDAKLRAMGRGVINEIHFTVTGQGDPAGAVTGERVIRAQVVSDRLLDRQGHVVFTPAVTASPTLKSVAVESFDASKADIAGLHVGVSAPDFAATLERLFGPVTSAPASKNTFAGFGGTIQMNADGCYSYPGRRYNPRPGAVCVTAFVDKAGIVRSIRIERLFTWFDSEVFRKALTQKYGPVAAARNGSTFSLGWGPVIDTALVYDRSGPHTALTAQYVPESDYFSAGNNSLENVRLVLNLVDAAWAAEAAK